LGDGTLIDRSSPVRVSGLGVVTQLPRGSGTHAMLVRTVDGIFAWGLSSSGSLGLGDAQNYNTPQRIQGF
jgi:hypothetical protein